jgi:hypothetical protein
MLQTFEDKSIGELVLLSFTREKTFFVVYASNTDIGVTELMDSVFGAT